MVFKNEAQLNLGATIKNDLKQKEAQVEGFLSTKNYLFLEISPFKRSL